jgi:hypothetical protein
MKNNASQQAKNQMTSYVLQRNTRAVDLPATVKKRGFNLNPETGEIIKL